MLALANEVGGPCFVSGLGATAAQLARQQAAAVKKQQRQAAAAAKKQAKVLGKNVNVRNAAAAQQVNQQVSALVSEGKSTTSAVLAATKNLRSANAAARTQAARQPIRPVLRAAMRGLGATLPIRRPVQAPVTQTSAQKSAVAQAKAAIKRASAFGAKIRANHGGIPATTVTASGTRPALRGLGYIDPITGFDDGMGDPSMQQGFTDPNAGYYPPPYQQTQQQSFAPSAIDTGLMPGFGSPFGGSFGSSFGQSSATLPKGCKAGSTKPICLIYWMAEDDRNQMMFIFTVMQQMYAQLLQIVQQLMAELQTAQQQPQPYYGPQGGYGGGYGDPYSQGGQYGYGGQYAGPGGGYGSDSSMIPPGYGDSGGPFDPGSANIPMDITQVYPGPGPMQYGPQASGPSAPNIISSDSLPDGAGPQTSEAYGGGDDAPIPAYIPAPAMAVAKNAPMAPPTSSQSVSAGPMQSFLVTQEAQPGQAPFPDLMLPAGENQDQPSLEPPSEVEDWAKGD